MWKTTTRNRKSKDHNRHSRDPELSEEDIKVTRHLVEAGQIMGIEVLKHVVVGKNSFCGFREKGLM